MTMNDKYNRQICWLWLVMSLGVGNPKIWDYLNKYTTVENTCRNIYSNNNAKKKIIDVQLTKQLFVDTLRKGIKIVCYTDEEYPNSLKSIDNPPCILFYRGDLNLLNHDRLLTVVGTRNPSDYTVRVTTEICNHLVNEGFILISGLAIGVDSISHKCCVNSNRPTVSVLACGIDYDYPKENIQLKREILNNGGLILTEQLPDTQPYRANFPKRNRILSGLGNGTLITEASLGSGALITANYTSKQGKNIFCIPPTDIFNDRYLGQAKYIREGAICVFNHNDILNVYPQDYQSKPIPIDTTKFENVHKVSSFPIFKAETIQNSIKESPINDKVVKTINNTKSSTPIEDISKDSAIIEEKLYQSPTVIMNDSKSLVVQSLKKGNTYLDDIANDTNIDISELFEIITELEIDGIVKSNFGNSYTLI